MRSYLNEGRPRRAAPTVRSEGQYVPRGSTFRGPVRSEGQYVPKASTFRRPVRSEGLYIPREFNTFQDDLLILQLVKQGGDAGAEDEAVDEAPEEHTGAAADGIVDC